VSRFKSEAAFSAPLTPAMLVSGSGSGCMLWGLSEVSSPRRDAANLTRLKHPGAPPLMVAESPCGVKATPLQDTCFASQPNGKAFCTTQA
jgi:hypothetical protein